MYSARDSGTAIFGLALGVLAMARRRSATRR
jgi:hypothetical protein